MSQLVPQPAVVTSTSSYSYSSSSSVSSTASSSTKVVKQTTVRSSSSVTTSSSSSNVAIKPTDISYGDQLAKDFGIDVNKEMGKLRLKIDEEMKGIHQDVFQLTPSESPQSLVKFDQSSINSLIDKSHGDNVKLNFDVNEYEAETINIKTVGNKIEVHAKKKTKKGDEERNEEYSRVYEMPTSGAIDANNVKTSFYKDGVLTVEIPANQAIEQKK